MNDTVTYGVAASAVTSPFWVQVVEGANSILATILTLLGILLTLFKIADTLDRRRKRRP